MEAATVRVYEDFVPPHNMVTQPATHTLSVDLSAAGYKKEHIKVQLVRNHGLVVVRGERAIAGNRWSRFRLELRVPDGCDVKGIHARFEGGVVRVTMPGLKTGPAAVGAAGGQVPAAAKTDAAGAQDGGVAREKARDHARGGEESRGGYSFHSDRKKLVTTVAAGGQVPAAAKTDAAGAQDGGVAREKAGDRARRGEDESVQKQQEEPQRRSEPQRTSAAVKDGGGRLDEGPGDVGGEEAVASPSRGGYSFHSDRRKLVTTVVGVVLVLFSLAIFVRYSLAP